ncbi:NYN domain-containing protein [Patescibacteria group bacterium]|nr:NYN domain-containing protein [Patescibacteria group bacterium]
MFTPKTEKIKNIAEEKKKVIKQLERVFDKKTRIYIDYANVRPWSVKLKWHVDLRRLKQFFDSFDTIEAINFYNGYLEQNEQSEKEIKEIENRKYVVRTKPVKILKFHIDASSISKDSTALLDQFIRRALLRKYEIGTIEYLNERFAEMNKKGEYYIEDRKCNFDVEIGVDMLLDCERNNAENFILWSGDSDFSDPIKKLLAAGKRVYLFSSAQNISKELSALTEVGLEIFDIQKIREFICWKKELNLNKAILESKEDPDEGALKH